MRIRMNWKADAILTQLAELGEQRQGPFIMARGLNILAKAVQKGIVDMLVTDLNVRRKQWMMTNAKIRPGTWATKKRLTVKVELATEAAFIADFEGGAERVPILGRHYMAIPNVRVFGNKVIGPDNPLRIKNLQLRQTPFGLKGLQRTFWLKSASTGTPLIMQRVGDDAKGKGKRGVNKATGLRILYTMVQHSHRPSKITWKQTSETVVREQQATIFAKVMQEALADPKKVVS